MLYPWGDERRYNSYKHFLKQHFGGRMQKLTLDAGFTCPNRDGKVGFGGCTYCMNHAFNPSYCEPQKSIIQQLEEGIEFHHNRYRRAKGYFAYFQAYTNTYAPLDQLKILYEEALTLPDIKGIIIATRPDCLEDSVLDYLEALQTRTYVSLEIGLESCRNATLKRIHRGHDLECAVKSFARVAAHHIPVGTHLIFGLPGESPTEWIEDLSLLNTLPIHEIKFHQLQIIKGTQMEQDYNHNTKDFYPMTLENYLDFMVDYIPKLNPNFVIERFAGEVPPRFLAVSNWCSERYDAVLQKIEHALAQNDTWQGKEWIP